VKGLDGYTPKGKYVCSIRIAHQIALQGTIDVALFLWHVWQAQANAKILVSKVRQLRNKIPQIRVLLRVIVQKLALVSLGSALVSLGT